MNTRPAAKRFVVALGLGAMFGLLCVFLAAQKQPEMASLTHPIFWAILTDRILIGLVVALSGPFTRHPVLGFPYRPWLRGACMGAVVSLPLAAGAMSGPETPQLSLWVIFAATLLAGGLYGALIDLVATKVGGEGKSLLAA
ncbi:MAG: hypothetical protein HQL80_02115 [Magnetococcales bacterium]|nr:hypothetical protein [Magnetococcales bacterium]